MSGALRRERLASEPWVFDVLELMRELERSHPEKPPIGTAPRLTDEIVRLRQEPFLAFPSCNLIRAEMPDRAGDPVELFVQFMGLFGPNGPLPLATTGEAHQWIHRRNDPAFARFADIFSERFVQLFYRAWADARPEVQMDRPSEDRFRAWTGALIGYGTPGLRERDALDDDTRRRLMGLWGSRVRGGARLIQLLRAVMEMDVDLAERVGSWLEFDPGELSRLGGAHATLGESFCVGARAYSVNDKLRVTLHCRSLAEYESCLPGQRECHRLVDFLHSYLGATVEVDIALTLPDALLPATRLGQEGKLGWTTFARPPLDEATDTTGDRVVCAVFSAAHLQKDDAPGADATTHIGPENAPPADTGARLTEEIQQ